MEADYQPGSTLYPVKLKARGSTYASVLYDVEGKPLVDANGRYLNVMRKEMKDAFDDGSIRLIHCMKEPTYRYFVVSENQKQRFQTHRDVGATRKILYHVYVDEDVDTNSYQYRELFIPNIKKTATK